MELIVLVLIFVSMTVGIIRLINVLSDIAESLRMLANNPKTIQEAKKIRLQTKSNNKKK